MNHAMLERRSEILKRNIHQMIIQDNQSGISDQQSMIMQHMIKELHQTVYEMNTANQD